MPTEPRNLNASALDDPSAGDGQQKLLVQWSQPDQPQGNIKGYSISWDENPLDNQTFSADLNKQLNAANTSKTIYTIGNLSACRLYYVKVVAITAIGAGMPAFVSSHTHLNCMFCEISLIYELFENVTLHTQAVCLTVPVPAPITTILLKASNSTFLHIMWAIPDNSSCWYSYDVCIYKLGSSICEEPNQTRLKTREGKRDTK